MPSGQHMSARAREKMPAHLLTPPVCSSILLFFTCAMSHVAIRSQKYIHVSGYFGKLQKLTDNRYAGPYISPNFSGITGGNVRRRDGTYTTSGSIFGQTQN